MEKASDLSNHISINIFTPACSDQSLGIFDKATPWERYSNILEKADINHNKSGRHWFSDLVRTQVGFTQTHSYSPLIP